MHYDSLKMYRIKRKKYKPKASGKQGDYASTNLGCFAIKNNCNCPHSWYVVEKQVCDVSKKGKAAICSSISHTTTLLNIFVIWKEFLETHQVQE